MPCRPPLCFLGRGKSCGSIPPFEPQPFYHNRNVRSGPLSASTDDNGAPSHISEWLPRFPPSLIATEGRVRHTDKCLARRTVDERNGSRPLLDGV